MSVWKVVKWVAYRLPILATAVFAIIFLTKDELSKSQSATLLLIVNTFKDHLALVLAGLLIFLCFAVTFSSRYRRQLGNHVFKDLWF